MMVAERARPWFTRQAQFGTRVIVLDPLGRGIWPEPVPSGLWRLERDDGPTYQGVTQWWLEFADEDAASAFAIDRCLRYVWRPSCTRCPGNTTWAEAEAWLREDTNR